MDIKKTATINFNSNFELSGTNNNANYYIDWSAILDDNKKYILTWTYDAQQQATNAFTNLTKLASVNINIFANNYNASTYGAGITQTIGSLKPDNNALYADTSVNMPLFLHSRPLDNNVNIQILTNDNPAVAWTDALAAVPNNYILTINFTEI